jgi:hypothetical protein
MPPTIYPCETPIPRTDVPFRPDRMLRINQALIAISVKKPTSGGLLHVLRSDRHQFSRATVHETAPIAAGNSASCGSVAICARRQHGGRGRGVPVDRGAREAKHRRHMVVDVGREIEHWF